MTNEIIHEHTVYAEPLFKIGEFNVTNSILNSWVMVLIVIIASLFIKAKTNIIPRGLQNYIEALIDLLLGVFDSVTGSKQKSLKIFPFIFSFFILILLSNWAGLLPGVGSIGMVVSEHGENIFVPYLRGGTADVNATFALAIIGVVASHIFGVLSIGIWNHLNKFINLKALAEIPHKIKEDKMVLVVSPVLVFVGLIEIVGEIAKVISLTFRLFGNVFAGEVLLATMSGILAFGLPIPFMFMEVLVGAMQAFIFSILVLSYLSMASVAHDH
ncbi:MAG: F0F1 ATP synthase subunit A [Candidatus Falkowbacteria bacterium]|nr:F0F1 ATP synthase subunit A [Candidatus Falkowbacteria bacterium]